MALTPSLLKTMFREVLEAVVQAGKLLDIDVLDHLMSLLETIKSNVELTSSLKDFYVSRVSLNMNKVIQLLTIVSVIFIPLTFLAGVYGMNFKNMPELHTRYGYFVLLGIMFLIFIGMLIFFKRKKWL